MNDETIRAGMHLQKAKIGKSREETKAILDEMGGDFEVEGLDLGPLQYRAVHAIQILLHQMDYRDHDSQPVVIHKSFLEASIPEMKIRPADYFEAFGLKKTSKNGRRYSNNEKRQAWAALQSLYQRRFILYYRKKMFGSLISSGLIGKLTPENYKKNTNK